MFNKEDIEKIARIRTGPTENAIVGAAANLKDKAVGVAAAPIAAAAAKADARASRIAEDLTNFKNKKINDAAVAYGKRRFSKAIDSASNLSTRNIGNAIGNFTDDLTGKKVKNLEYQLDDAI